MCGMPADPALAPLISIPNVGPAIARRLLSLGVSGQEDLAAADPEELFERACGLAGRRQDRRCATVVGVLARAARWPSPEIS